MLQINFYKEGPMDQNNVQQEIAIVREMIEKTRRETAESGNFFIVMGLLCSLFPWVMGMLAKGNSKLFMPAIIIFIIIGLIIGFIISARDEKKEKVKTYAKAIQEKCLGVCGLVCIMVVTLFPMLNAIPWSAVPIIISLLVGIMVFQTGIINELESVARFGFLWFAGAIAMAIIPEGIIQMAIISVLFLAGWVLPGLILKKKCSNRGA